ncbi:MAG TPA: RNA 2',3'-cyclic phosphodiesterase [Candidatus Elarobacter sp.]|nr:RNA 2',3'-cyclic phosphodiesterase [Candidatus Elarobacter sp.]
MKQRLFVAAGLDDETRAACGRVAEKLRAKGWFARYVPPDNYHLTVAFLGGVDEQRVDEIVAALREIAPRIPPVDVPLERVGAFPSERRPRVAWIGPNAPLPAYGTLCGAVRSALTVLGFTFDRNADPHVTLARADATTRGALPQVTPPPIDPMRIDALTLYRSFTDRSGARYEALDRFALRP